MSKILFRLIFFEPARIRTHDIYFKWESPSEPFSTVQNKAINVFRQFFCNSSIIESTLLTRFFISHSRAEKMWHRHLELKSRLRRRTELKPFEFIWVLRRKHFALARWSTDVLGQRRSPDSNPDDESNGQQCAALIQLLCHLGKWNLRMETLGPNKRLFIYEETLMRGLLSSMAWRSV